MSTTKTNQSKLYTNQARDKTQRSKSRGRGEITRVLKIEGKKVGCALEMAEHSEERVFGYYLGHQNLKSKAVA